MVGARSGTAAGGGGALNDLAAVTDPLGRSSVFFTDTLGRVTQTVNPLGHFSSYAYDANGNLTSFTDPRGGVTEYTWDAKNRMTQRKDPLLKTESFGYDLSDNLTSHTDRKSQVTAYTYDELDRRTLTTWHGGATTAYTYDVVDRLTQITDSVSGTITRQYDNRFDAVTQEVTPLGAGTTTINYTYDAAGRRTQMQTVGQTAVTYGYDNANRLTGITQGANSVGITYDAASRRTVTTIPNGVSMEYGYDNANQLTAITYKRSGSTIGGLTYTYDNAGRRTSMGGTYARTNLPPGLTTTAYDANNRLTNWNGTTYTYDHNGNLTSDGVRTHTWNVRDQLTGLSGGGTTASFTYDAFNRRRDRTINGSHNDFIYDGWQPIHTLNGTTISGTLLSGMRLDERYARITSGGTTALVSDAQDSLIHMIDSAGNTTATLTYEPYGKPTHSGSDSTGYRYTGQLEDATGLMYYRNRYYDPRTSRFISEDPIGLEGGYNLYAYVDGDPIRATDPLGWLKWKGEFIGAGAGSKNFGRYRLVSECIDGWQTEVIVDIFAGSWGPGASVVWSAVEFTDNFTYVNPHVFDGIYANASGGIAAGFGPSFDATILGGAQSPGGWSAVSGIGAWIGVASGWSKVSSQKHWRCTCSQ